jgi:hypothetical protein
MLKMGQNSSADPVDPTEDRLYWLIVTYGYVPEIPDGNALLVCVKLSPP